MVRAQPNGRSAAAAQQPQSCGQPLPGSLPAPAQNASYKFKYAGGFQEDHREPLFCVTFNNFDYAHRDVFATVGQHRASIYRLLPGGGFELLQVFEDEDRGRKAGGGGAAATAAAVDGEGGSGAGGPGAAGAAGGGGGTGGAAAAAGAITPTGEHFYSCKWTRDAETGAALLLVAGEKALIRVLDVHRGCLVHTFAGHGKGINDLAVHPDRPHLFLSASDDESVRLWNIRSRTCVAIFSGEGGHRNKVLSLDFHPWDGHRFLSSGMDNAVKIWSLEPIQRLIDLSDQAQEGCVGGGVGDAAVAGGPRRAFPTRVVQQPLFSTLQVHNDYVDCVRWLGDQVLSKSVHDVITLWRPHGQSKHRRPPAGAAGASGGGGGGEDSDSDGGGGPSAAAGGRMGGETIASRATRIMDFNLSESLRTWFVRFSCDVNFSVLACGSARGKVFVFSPVEGLGTPNGAPKVKLAAPQCKTVVRQTAVSWDGTTILAACEDGFLHRWDLDSGDVVMQDA